MSYITLTQRTKACGYQMISTEILALVDSCVTVYLVLAQDSVKITGSYLWCLELNRQVEYKCWSLNIGFGE